MTKVAVMDRAELEQIVRRLAGDQAGRSADEVALDHRFREDLDFDSLAMVDFIMHLEDALNLSIPDEAVEGTKSVREAVDMVAGLLVARAG